MILLYALLIAAFFVVLLCCAFVFGFRTAKSIYLTKDLNVKAIIPTIPKKAEESKSQRLQRIISQNVDNYGTSNPQMEVK